MSQKRERGGSDKNKKWGKKKPTAKTKKKNFEILSVQMENRKTKIIEKQKKNKAKAKRKICRTNKL